MAETEIIKQLATVEGLVGAGDYARALGILSNLENEFPESSNLLFNKVGFYTDIGFGLNEKSMIEYAIEVGEHILKQGWFKDLLPALFYNLANGYISLFNLENRTNRKIQNYVDNLNLQQAKSCYRSALEYANETDSDFNLQLLTNYGNCLDKLGRGVEALYAYESALSIDPDFPMAIANKAKALRYFADICNMYRAAMYITSYQLLKSVIDEDGLQTYGGAEARESFRAEMEFIESCCGDKSILSKQIDHQPYNWSKCTKFKKFYIDYCLNNRLFLNLHNHHDCKASVADPVFIRLITGVGEEEDNRFYDLAKSINQIKEDYAVARFLLVQSQFKRNDLTRISKLSTLVNTLDYSNFNLYTALLKTAFDEAYSILDKIAVFLNRYIGLGIKGKIYYTTIWQSKKSRKNYEIRTQIRESENISLYALYDIFLDFKNGVLGRIQKIRNASTHERLVIYDSFVPDEVLPSNECSLRDDDMLNQTIDLLHLVKSAIIYLINFVNSQENRRSAGENTISIPMYVDSKQYIY